MTQGLFGGSADIARQQVMQSRLRQANLLGQLGPGGHGALAGGLIGSGISGLFGGSNPIVSEAQKLQAIGQQMDAEGIQPGTPGFGQQVFRRMIAAGFPQQQAIKAFQAASEAEKTQAETAQLRAAAPDPQAAQFRFRALIAAGIPEQSAVVLAQDAKQTADALKDVRGSKRPTEAIRTLETLQKRPDLAAVQAAQRRAGATNVTIRQGDRPAAKSDRDLVTTADGRPVPTAMTPNQIDAGVANGTLIQKSQAAVDAERLVAKALAEKKLSREQAAPILRHYVDALRTGNKSRVAATGGQAAQAYARLRNPTGIVTDDDVRLAGQALAGLGAMAVDAAGFDLMEEKIIGMQVETGVSLGGTATAGAPDTGLQPTVRVWNPQTGRLE